MIKIYEEKNKVEKRKSKENENHDKTKKNTKPFNHKSFLNLCLLLPCSLTDKQTDEIILE